MHPAELAPLMSLKTFFLRLFTWWNGQTLNTQVWTWLYGVTPIMKPNIRKGPRYL